jgi:hypothetical protein
MDSNPIPLAIIMHLYRRLYRFNWIENYANSITSTTGLPITPKSKKYKAKKPITMVFKNLKPCASENPR